jgi:hypothetical protein
MPTSEISDILEVDEEDVNSALDGIRSRIAEVRKALVHALYQSETVTGDLVGAGATE